MGIIHLVRDPRGIVNSRYKIHKQWPVRQTENTCKRLVTNAKLGEERPEWLDGRYMRVRYEDLALRPMEVAEEIYKFVDLPFVPEVRSWISQNTHATSGLK